MENLRSIGVFVRVAELHSFGAAAVVLGRTPSAVSKSITVLERSLGVRLLVRSARGVSLTDDGARFLARCRTIVAELQAAERELTVARGVPRGRLRVALHTSPANSHILPALPRFLRSHPELRLDVTLVAGALSLDAKDFDVGVFLGDAPESSLVARRIAQRHFLTCASRTYVERHGAPRTPQQLIAHNCVLHVPPHGRPQNVWSFRKGEQHCDVTVCGNFSINDGPPLIHAVLAGLGIFHLPSNNIEQWLAAERDLVPLLTDWFSEAPPVQVMYSRGRGASPKVRAFVEFVTALFEEAAPGAGAALHAGPQRRWPMIRASSVSP